MGPPILVPPRLLKVHSTQVGRFNGKGGANILSLEARLNVTISISTHASVSLIREAEWVEIEIYFQCFRTAFKW